MMDNLYLAFRHTGDEFSVYVIENWNVVNRGTVQKSTSGSVPWVCGCKLFGISGSCGHIKTVCTEVTKKITGPGKYKEMTGGGSLIYADPSVIHGSIGNKYFRISGTIGDVSLDQLAWMIINGTVLPSFKNISGKLNSRSLLRQVDGYLRSGDSILTKESADLSSKLEKKSHVSTTPSVKPTVRPRADWQKVDLPDPNVFYVKNTVWSELHYSLHYSDNCLLLGSSGCGKSELCYVAADAAKREITPINCGALGEARTALIGKITLDKDGTKFEMSRFAKAVGTENSIILLDELSRATSDAFNILLPLLDDQGYLPLDESEGGGILKKAPGVCFVATANVGMAYTGTEHLDKALKERFGSILTLEFPPSGKEINLLIARCKVSNLVAEKLVRIANVQRDMYEKEEFTEQISTRMLIRAAERIARGMDFKDACNHSILGTFDALGGDSSHRTMVRQIIQKVS